MTEANFSSLSAAHRLHVHCRGAAIRQGLAPLDSALLSQLPLCEIIGNAGHVAVAVICLGADHTGPGAALPVSSA